MSSASPCAPSPSGPLGQPAQCTEPDTGKTASKAVSPASGPLSRTARSPVSTPAEPSAVAVREGLLGGMLDCLRWPLTEAGGRTGAEARHRNAFDSRDRGRSAGFTCSPGPASATPSPPGRGPARPWPPGGGALSSSPQRPERQAGRPRAGARLAGRAPAPERRQARRISRPTSLTHSTWRRSTQGSPGIYGVLGARERTGRRTDGELRSHGTWGTLSRMRAPPVEHRAGLVPGRPARTWQPSLSLCRVPRPVPRGWARGPVPGRADAEPRRSR